jgi:hypothetical protein
MQLIFIKLNYWEKNFLPLNFIAYHLTTVCVPPFETHCFRKAGGLLPSLQQPAACPYPSHALTSYYFSDLF